MYADKRSYLGAAVIAAAMIVSTASVAQVAPAAPTSAGAADKRVEQRINQLHAQLKITQAEQPQWDQFAGAMRASAESFEQKVMERGSKLSSMKAPDVMQSYAELAQDHAVQMQQLAASFQALYNSFPPEQKQEADAVFRAKTPRGTRVDAPSH